MAAVWPNVTGGNVSAYAAARRGRLIYLADAAAPSSVRRKSGRSLHMRRTNLIGSFGATCPEHISSSCPLDAPKMPQLTSILFCHENKHVWDLCSVHCAGCFEYFYPFAGLAFIRKFVQARDALIYLPPSSSASRPTAGAFGFLLLILPLSSGQQLRPCASKSETSLTVVPSLRVGHRTYMPGSRQIQL